MAEEHGESDRPEAKDPFAALAQFREELLRPEPDVGQIWWLPRQHVGDLKPGNDAYCLMAIAERSGSGDITLLHYVAGSKSRTSDTKTLRLEPDENGLYHVTYFRFWKSRGLPPTSIKADGTCYGKWPDERRSDIEAAIRASNLVTLKRLLDD